MSKLLTEQDFKQASLLLDIEVPVIKAVAEVESRGDGFLPDGRPKILFEAHIFGSLTKYKYVDTHPNICSKTWNKSLYKGGAKEYERLEEAMKLDKEAALKSASWGKFQIMGFNHKLCGWDTVESFVDDMYKSEFEHLKAFIGFIKANNLIKYLKNKDWASFARGYNGPKYKENQYDIKLENAYKKYLLLEQKNTNNDTTNADSETKNNNNSSSENGITINY